MRVHLVQLDIAWEDKPANHERVRALLDDAAPGAGDLIVLPEMFDTGFSLNVDATNDSDHASFSFVEKLAMDLRCCVQGAQTIRRNDGKGLNRALCIDPTGRVIAEYDKVHPFSYGRESERFVGGGNITTYRWAGPDGRSLRVCPLVCYDLRFPELFRAGIDAGAEAFAIGANWPSPRQSHWRSLLIARAIENQAWVFGVNRCGDDPHLGYRGGSIVVDPKGRAAGEAGDREEVLSVEVDPEAPRRWRDEFPALHDRRPDVYRRLPAG